jgi:hypothetical protein
MLFLLSLGLGPAYSQENAHIEQLCSGICSKGHIATDFEMRVLDIAPALREASHAYTSGPSGFEVERQKLRDMFDNRHFSCQLVVRTDGSIAKLKVARTSGSDEVDNKGLDLIQSSAPFRPALVWRHGQLPKEMSFLVEFPFLTVTQLK